MTRPTLVVLTKLPGLLPVKTRLWELLGEAGAQRLYAWMLQQTVERLGRIAPPVVAYSPPDADPRQVLPPLGACELLPTPGEDGAECLEEALRRSFVGAPLVAFGGDSPDFPEARVHALLSALTRHDAALVPSTDGGFSALALRRPVAGLASAFGFGRLDAAAAVGRFLALRGRSCAVLEPWPDVDTPEDLRALLRRLAQSTPATRVQPRHGP